MYDAKQQVKVRAVAPAALNENTQRLCGVQADHENLLTEYLETFLARTRLAVVYRRT